MYLIIFVSDVAFFMKILYGQAIFSINTFSFALTKQCAAVVRNNKRLEVQNKIFCFKLLHLLQGQTNQNIYNKNQIVFLLKTETFQASKRLYSFVFKLAFNRRITPNSFNIVKIYNFSI